MKFIHTADFHLGMEPDRDCSWSKMRGRELWDAFSGINETCRKEKTDLLLIAGDLFHKQPLMRELKEAAGLLASIPETGVVIIAGNHDYISGTSGYRNFKWPDNVHFLMSGETESVYFENINTEVYGFSYHTRDIFDPLLDGIRPADPSRINILLGHGGEPSKLPTDFKRLERAGFDYVAMGHLHKPIDISENIRYSGSPEPLDLNETGRHGYIAGEICIENESGVPGKRVSTTRVDCARREYIKAEIETGIEDTYGSLRKKVKAFIDDKGDENIYILRLYGEYDPQISFDLDGLSDLGLIVRIIDETRPKLDLKKLYTRNAGNVIGMFIERMLPGIADQGDAGENRESSGPDSIREKALYYGIMALTKNCPQNYY